MDYFLIILLFLQIILLYLFYVFLSKGKNKNTKNELETFKLLLIKEPTTKAFNAGYDKIKKLFKNVYLITEKETSEIKTSIKYETFPVLSSGDALNTYNHGKIIDNLSENNFTILGLNNNVPIPCPLEIYSGKGCLDKIVCTKEECQKNRKKLLNYMLFNSVGFYEQFKFFNDSEFKRLHDDKDKNLQYHPKLWIQCFMSQNGNTPDWALLKCTKENEILNVESIECQDSDICINKVNGFKHNLKISPNDQPLKPNEYYMCKNNKSEKQICEDEKTIFSEAQNGCIFESKCFGLGDIEIKIDEHSYVKCSNDLGIIINCPDGVVELEPNNYSCKTKKCQESVKIFENFYLKYEYAKTRCIDDEPHIIDCRLNDSYTKNIEIKWYETTDFIKIENYPRQILSASREFCTSDFHESNVLKKSATAYIRYTEIMPEEHLFNLYEMQYVCPEPDTYQWNYDLYVVIPQYPNGMDNHKFLDSVKPCSRIIDMKESFVGKVALYLERNLLDQSDFYANIIPEPQSYYTPFLYYIKFKVDTIPLWPFFDKKTNKYTYISDIDYNVQALKVTVSERMPYNFVDNNNMILGDRSFLTYRFSGNKFYIEPNLICNYSPFVFDRGSLNFVSSPIQPSDVVEIYAIYFSRSNDNQIIEQIL